MSITDSIVNDLINKGFSVNNHNNIVETKLNGSKYTYSKTYRKKYRKKYEKTTNKPLAKI